MEKKNLNPIYLYVLMRTDLASMSCGKSCAQATHSANQCVFEVKNSSNEQLKAELEEWQSETPSGFGTCIVLGVNEKQMRDAVASAREFGIHSGITHDPTYPLLDGEVLHLIPLDTCAYVFGRKDHVRATVQGLSLMR